ncbi:MAG: hypothetical protein JKY80_06170 [Mariprofundaceae bacterium]|nr:hypothetical protein [Mariprofundaceae bacterium]
MPKVIELALPSEQQPYLVIQWLNGRSLSEFLCSKELSFDQKFERFSKSFVEQIESLSSIASEFSAFAKMPDTRIERLNILHATMLAMRRCVEALPVKPSEVVVDGNRVPDMAYPVSAVIGGDDLVQEIAAASIVAKVVRDRLMRYLDYQYPEYQFAKHKGYGTQIHMDALREHGPCPIHRMDFSPVKKYAKLHAAGR